MAKNRNDNNPSEPSDRRSQARARAQQEAAATKRRKLVRQLVFVGALAVLAVIIVGSAVFFGMRSQNASGPNGSGTVTVGGSSVSLAVGQDGIRVGPENAKAQIDLWVDYSCPHCAEFEAANNTTLNDLVAGGNTSVTYHNIQIVTQYGAEAGSAGACVATNDPAKWPALNAALYSNHSTQTDAWTAGEFATFAGQQGVNDAAKSCIQNSTYKSWITKNTAAAAAKGVQSTPTMFINGQKQDPTPSGEELKAKVAALAQA